MFYALDTYKNQQKTEHVGICSFWVVGTGKCALCFKHLEEVKADVKLQTELRRLSFREPAGVSPGVAVKGAGCPLHTRRLRAHLLSPEQTAPSLRLHPGGL